MRPSRLVAIFVAAVLLVGGSWPASAKRQAAPAPPTVRPQHLVVIVMDGFRPDYEKLAPMRHLRALMAQGMSYDSAWAGQLESETPASHATLATGVYPRKHGVIGFGWRDPVTDNFTYMPTNIPQIKAGDLYKVIEQSGVPTISDLIHQRNRHDLTISLSGEKLWASAPMGTGADYVLYGRTTTGRKNNVFAPFVVGPNVPPPKIGYAKITNPDGGFDTQDGFAARLAVKLVTALRPRALLLNLPGADLAGHYYGGIADPKDMAPIVRQDDYAIGRVVNAYKHLGIYKDTLFVVVADHGMVSGYHRVPIHQIYDAVRKSNFAWLDEELQPSLGSIWLREPSQAGSLAGQIASDHFAGVEGALYKVLDASGMRFVAEPSTASKLGPALTKAYVDLANTEASTNGADILLPYNQSTTGLQPSKKFRGMHGGFQWVSQHIPLVMAGPGVRHGLSHFPAKLVDVAPTIERLMGLAVPNGVDGVVLADGLKQPAATDRQGQNSVAPGRTADVQALEKHSGPHS